MKEADRAWPPINLFLHPCLPLTSRGAINGPWDIVLSADAENRQKHGEAYNGNTSEESGVSGGG